MKTPCTAIVAPAALGLALCGSAFGNNTDTNTESLRAEVASLKAQVAKLSADENWLTDQRSEEIRSLVQDVLADADTRASLLQSGMSAGYDKGFFLASTDGNFKLNIAGTLQVRFDYNNRDESDDDDNRWGFENRRTRLRFFGNVVDPTWKYFIQSDFGTSGTLGLLDAYIKKDFENNWYALGGKFVLPFSREMLVSHSKQLLVERSIVQNYFLVGRSQGVMFGYKGEQFKFDAAISDGMGAAGGTAAGALVEDSEYALTARAEFLAQGTWDQFKDFTSWEGEEFGFLLGGAVHFEADEYGTAAGPESETFRWTVDGSFEFGAANLYAAIFGNHVTADGMEDMDQYGFVLHGGVFLNEDWELFGRYEWADEDATGIDDLNIITVGIVKYFSGHQIKWTTDLGYALDEVTSTFSTAGAGWQADASGQDGQTVLRTQLQVLF